jgi:hypothetical protein
MKTKNTERLLTLKIFIFLFFINFLISLSFTQDIPYDYKDYQIDIEFGPNIKFMRLLEDTSYNAGIIKDKKVKGQANRIIFKWREIIRMQLLPDYFKNINLPEGDPKRLPSCVIEALDSMLSNKKIKIKFATFSELSVFTAPDDSTGAVPILMSPAVGLYDDIDDLITIYGLYKDIYYKTKEDWEKKQNGYCTASILFHEMLHQALYHALKKKDLKERFCVKIEGTEKIDCYDPKTGEKYKYPAKRCTNKENMDENEGIAENCEKILLLTNNSVFYKIVNTSYNMIIF